MPNLRRIFGEGPYPFPLEKVTEVFDIYANEHVAILDPKMPLDFNEEQGRHYHSDYEFVLPGCSMPYMGAEAKAIRLEKDHILPLNSGQTHGPTGPMLQTSLLALSIEKDFLNRISEAMYGKAGVEFANQGDVHFPELQHLMQQFREEIRNKQAGYQFILDCLSTQIVVLLLRRLKSNIGGKEKGKSERPTSKKEIARVIEFLHDAYNHEYTLAELAQIANLSRHHFIRVFKAETGKTPFAFLLDFKIEKARELLKQGRLSVTEICFQCGFNSLSHFTTVFKQKTGVTPSEYRQTVSF